MYILDIIPDCEASETDYQVFDLVAFNATERTLFSRIACKPEDLRVKASEEFARFLNSRLSHVTSLLNKVETACWEVIA